jgi:cellulose synthase/poly-beta-1,6-N-acetylglucosamine synthase-like glycosyltransferase
VEISKSVECEHLSWFNELCSGLRMLSAEFVGSWRYIYIWYYMIIYDLYDICVSLVYIPSLGFPMNGVSSTFWMIFWLVEILQSRCCAHLCHMQNHDIVWYRDIYNIMINVCEPNLCNWIPLVPHIHTVLLYIDANITVYHYVVYNCDIYIYTFI